MDDDVEATRLIAPLSDDAYLKEAQKLLDKRLNVTRPPQPFELYRNKYPAYSFGDGEKKSYIILADEYGEVAYFVRYRRVSHNGFRLGRQVLLLRNSRSPAAGGFAQHVFFDILLPKYTALISDQEQTNKGQQFWLNAMQSAWARNLYVYFLDRRSRQTELHEIQDAVDLGFYEDDIWGSTRAHELTFAVISKRPLSL